jgi:hypothetical protein
MIIHDQVLDSNVTDLHASYDLLENVGKLPWRGIPHTNAFFVSHHTVLVHSLAEGRG